MVESPEVARPRHRARRAPVVALEAGGPDPRRRREGDRSRSRRSIPTATRSPTRSSGSSTALETGVTGEMFPADRLRSGALLTARVVASDGELAGPARARARPASATRPGRAADRARARDAARGPTRVRARIDVPATDPDGDPLVYRYRWKVDGRAAQPAAATSALPPGRCSASTRRSRWRCARSTASRRGRPRRAAVTVRNTPPTAPRVEIRPARPRRGERAARGRRRAVGATRTATRSPTAFAWRKNGAPLQVGDRRRPRGPRRRGRARRLVRAHRDGERRRGARPGGHGEGDRVGNTPPVAAAHRHRARAPEGRRAAAGRRSWSPPATWTASASRSPSPGRATEAPTGDGGETLAAGAVPRSTSGCAWSSRRATARSAGPPADRRGAGRRRAARRARRRVRARAPDRHGAAARGREGPGEGSRRRRGPLPVPLDPRRRAVRGARRDAGVARDAVLDVRERGAPRRRSRKGQRWTVEVRAHDGEQVGPPVARASVAIVNSPPPAPRIAFAPERPRRVDGIAVALEQPPDPTATSSPTGTRGRARASASRRRRTRRRSRAASRRSGERWAVEVVASDGEAESPAARHEVVIADTAPGPAAVALCDGPVPAGTVPQARVDRRGDRPRRRRRSPTATSGP